MPTYLPHSQACLREVYGYNDGMAIRYCGTSSEEGIVDYPNGRQKYGAAQLGLVQNPVRKYDKRSSGPSYASLHSKIYSTEDETAHDHAPISDIYNAPALGITVIADVFLPFLSTTSYTVIDTIYRETVIGKGGFPSYRYYGLRVATEGLYLALMIGYTTAEYLYYLAPHIFGRWNQIAVMGRGISAPPTGYGPTSGSAKVFINGHPIADLCSNSTPTINLYGLANASIGDAAHEVPGFRIGQWAAFGQMLSDQQILHMYNTHRQFSR